MMKTIMKKNIDKTTLLWIYERMRLIREFEEQLREDFAAGKIPGFVHLYAGEEAVAVGVCAHLTNQDFITSTHRGHGHCIAKEVDLNGMMAEIHGKASGLCGGKGGSMHIADVSKGMLGANGIVGGGPPLACGAALTSKVNQTDQVTICFFGDGASNQGETFESVNLAAIWDLPVVFVCENNGYAETTSPDYSVAGGDIAARMLGFGIPCETVDGQNVFDMYEAAQKAIARARRGEGPSYIEAKTYRYYGHFEGDTVTYRTKKEEEYYRSRDCIDQFRTAVLDQNELNAATLDALDKKAKDAVQAAVQYAQESPDPAPQDILTNVYADFPKSNMWPFQTAAI
jgi:TPP-dependent pyruvate/acetoin dehydrogenase alpha subunit